MIRMNLYEHLFTESYMVVLEEKSFYLNEVYIFKYDEHIHNLAQFIPMLMNEKVVFAFSMIDLH